MSRARDDDERNTELALAAGKGDRRALEAWVRGTQADVWRFLAHSVNPAAADDLTQETYLRAFGSLPRFAGRASSRTWLLSIARRVVVDQIRSASARPKVFGGVDWQRAMEDQATRAGQSAGFEDMVELGLMLRGLDEDRREAIVLTQVLGLSYAEVAEICGCPVGTVRSRVSRGREDLLRAQEENNNAM
ncbi:sigma-70 family RNA polymerase sigma factor [Amycolatopsis sp. cg5]|uniref:sigma-70 family RNA polymerase sigma factor n=1 Tax=Amycolatopsis sp. cg5 TaxID=3238802 RepID=UPI0035255D10